MKLLTKEILEKLPKLYTQEEKGLEAVAIVKFFTPDSNWTWYATEFDGDDLFFGLVDSRREYYQSKCAIKIIVNYILSNLHSLVFVAALTDLNSKLKKE